MTSFADIELAELGLVIGELGMIEEAQETAVTLIRFKDERLLPETFSVSRVKEAVETGTPRELECPLNSTQERNLEEPAPNQESAESQLLFEWKD